MGALKQRWLRWTACFWRWLSAWLGRDVDDADEAGAPPQVLPPPESRMTIDVVQSEVVPPGIARLAALLDACVHESSLRPPDGLAADRP
jgi:hypothetical protein